MTLRNVPKAHTLEQQRQEINLIASDLNTAVDGTQTFGGSKEFSGDVTFNDATEFTGATNLISGSNKLNFNTNTNQEGQLWANSDNFYINSSATNGMLIQANSIALRSGTGGENYFTASINAGARLYHNDVQKFETTATGVNISGNIDDVTDISCNSIINNAGGAPTFSIFNTGNALFEDVEATSLHMKDDRPAYFGTNEDASLYYDNTSSDLRLDSEVGFHVRWYDSANTQYEDQAVFSPFGSTSFYYQGAATPTLSIDDGVDVRGVVTVGSNTEVGEVRLGVGGTQANYLKIFASSGETYIRNRDNDIGGTATTINIQGRTGVALWQDTGNLGLQVDSSCAVKLYYQTSEKLKTTTDGVEITGTITGSGTLTIPNTLTIDTDGVVDVTSSTYSFIGRNTSGNAYFAVGDGGFTNIGAITGSNSAIILDGTNGNISTTGNLTLSDDTKELTAQTFRPTTIGSVMRFGAVGNQMIFDSDIALFSKIGFGASVNYGLQLGHFGTGALSSSSVATGTNGVFRRYEEGEWTGTVSSTNPNLSAASFVEGYYTRIGQLVYIEGEVSYTNTGNNTELGFTITPPFDMATDGDKGSVFCGSSYWSASRGFGGVVDNTSANDNEIFVMLHQAQNDTGTTGVCRFSLTYHAA